MKNLKHIFLGITIIVVVWLGYFLFSRIQQSSAKALDTIVSNEDGIDVSVTPKDWSKEYWGFEVGLDTHSVELDYDLVEISTLVDGKGNSYKAFSWEGDPSGGHHIGGVLKFKPITPKPERVDLKINLGGKERSFKWKI